MALVFNFLFARQENGRRVIINLTIWRVFFEKQYLRFVECENHLKRAKKHTRVPGISDTVQLSTRWHVGGNSDEMAVQKPFFFFRRFVSELKNLEGLFVVVI